MSHIVQLDAGRNVDAFSIAWKNLSYTIQQKGKGDHTILFPQSGIISEGCMLAVLGPSGAGKSTFLDVLAGRKDPKNVGGDVFVNGKVAQKLKHISTYVMQDDALIGCLTVRETISYAGQLMFPSTLSEREKTERVTGIIQDFGLAGVANSKIGNQLVRGISGGEKRRVTLASQLLTLPKIIFLDEPTSGLDSAAAFHVISGIKKLAVSRRLIVIATIHQPAPETYDLFDNLLLLAQGNALYFGPRAAAPPYFASQGFPLPAERNPADHYLSMVNVDFMEPDLAARTANDFKENWNRSAEKVIIEQTVNEATNQAENESKLSKLRKLQQAHVPGYPRSILWQTWVLCQRNFKNAYRNVVLFWIRIAMYVMLAILMGTIWLDVGTHQAAVQDRFSALFFSIAFPSFMSVAGIPAFLEDRLTMVRERNNGAYSPFAYALANTLVSLPFVFLIGLAFSVVAYFLIGLHPGGSHFWIFVSFMFLALYTAESIVVLVAAIIPIFVVALTLVAFLNGFFMLVQGYFVQKSNLPDFWYYWAHFIDYQKYAFEGLIYNDFVGLTFRCAEVAGTCQCMYASSSSSSSCTFSGADVLAHFAYQDIHMAKWAGILVGMIVIFRIAFGFVLWFKKN